MSSQLGKKNLLLLLQQHAKNDKILKLNRAGLIDEDSFLEVVQPGISPSNAILNCQ